MVDRFDLRKASDDVQRAAAEFARRMYEYRADNYRVSIPQYQWLRVGVFDCYFGIWRKNEYGEWTHRNCEDAEGIPTEDAICLLSYAEEIEAEVRRSAENRYSELRSLVAEQVRRAAVSYCYG